MICVKFTAFCDLRIPVWPPFASPYARSVFANLRRLASLFGQSYKSNKTTVVAFSVFVFLLLPKANLTKPRNFQRNLKVRPLKRKLWRSAF